MSKTKLTMTYTTTIEGTQENIAVNEYTEIVEISTRGKTEKIDGMKSLQTEDGRPVERLSAAEFKIKKSGEKLIVTASIVRT